MTRSPDTPRPLAAGNWKMNGLAADAAEIALLAAKLVVREVDADVLICPPATLLARMAVAFEGQGIAFGAQDCHRSMSGAHTGDISADMIADAGGTYVIVGHSERRAGYGESDDVVAAKAAAGQGAGLTAIICVGETLAEREAGKALAVVDAQILGSVPPGSAPDNTVIAYEPVWAIGTGKTPSSADIMEVHAAIRARLGNPGFRILYGGSVKPANAREILSLPNVDGALVGGASLKAADFDAILDAYR